MNNALQSVNRIARLAKRAQRDANTLSSLLSEVGNVKGNLAGLSVGDNAAIVDSLCQKRLSEIENVIVNGEGVHVR